MENDELLKEVYSIFVEKTSKLNFYQSFVKHNSESNYRSLLEQKEIIDNNKDLKNSVISMNNMTCRSPINGHVLFIGQNSSTIDEKIKALKYHQNKQYQWLLTEAYENFEDYLDLLYARIGSIDKNFWSLSDYGSISLNEVNNKDIDWFLSQAKNKRQRPKSIINQIRKKIPTLAIYESKNALNVNFNFIINLVANVRHVIVHNNGFVNCKGDFIAKVLKDSGIYNNGKYDKKFSEYIEAFFEQGEYENLIVLLEFHTESKLPIKTYYSRFSELFERLCSYVVLIQSIVENSRKKHALHHT